MNKRRITAVSVVLLTSLSLVSVSTFADPGGKNHGNNGGNHGHSDQGNSNKGNNGNQNNGHQSGQPAISISYSDARRLAVNYGLTGYQSLPPGIAKNLARGKPLPPGIAKKAVPSNMLRDLPNYPGYEWRIVGDDLVLIALSTAIVTSIINGVFD
ncbi:MULTISPECIES: anti-virulence regulator CigR family protein [Hafnia]|uniref:anti-virulence regulator CigR family protein n=1 Tax=Hafnia TaxID=568 RepID=UPI0008A116C6|nr:MULTISPECIES: anti-virulence regulator CigR family protein [Hafnia]MBW2956616.1 RcnB family protein [Hafnia paralvei]OFS08044.1 hypothetical protein HMPREF3091_20255 [Hafnia sp. HMSC23F03]